MTLFEEKTQREVADGPSSGDIYHCVKCNLEIVVTKDCDNPKSHPVFVCCNLPMRKI